MEYPELRLFTWCAGVTIWVKVLGLAALFAYRVGDIYWYDVLAVGFS